MISPEVRAHLAAALASRLKEAGGAPPTAILAQGPPDAQAEEVLRRVMVRHFPRAQRTASKARGRYLSLLVRLEASARDPDDLRYLDAFNNAWEVLQPGTAPSDPALARFLLSYRSLLSLHLERLR